MPVLHEWQFYWRRWSFGWCSYPDNSIKPAHVRKKVGRIYLTMREVRGES